MGLADVHAHVTHSRFFEDIDAVLDRAREAGLSTVVANGLGPEDNEAVRALAARDPLVKPAYGLYPVDAVWPEMKAGGFSEDYARDLGDLDTATAVAWLRDHVDEAFAVGEIGLDGYWVPEPLWARQEEVFRQLVQIALDGDKTIIVHARARERRAWEILQEMEAPRVDWHCFGGKVKLARRIAQQPGQYFSIPANAERVPSFTRLLETLPRDRVLLETDCPYLSPHRGRRNEPASVAVSARFTAKLWGTSLASVTDALADNFTALFGVAP